MSKKNKIITFLIIAFLPLAIFYFLNFDFRGTINNVYNSFCQGVIKEESKIPQSWLDRYQIRIEIEEDLAKDSDNDGLSLLEEYNNSTNPLDADTDKDGYNDGKEVRDGYNPVGEGRLDLDKDGLPDFWEKETGLDLKKDDADLDNDKDGLLNKDEFAHLTNPLKSDTDNDGFTDLIEIKNGYDPVVMGEARPTYELKIDKIKVQAPIIWSLSSEEASIQEDLKSGVVRLPDTGILGQRGNAVISGHSSNYVWVKGNYNYIFKDLNDLNIGDEIIIKTTQKNGKSFETKYKITNKDVTAPDDQRIFADNGKPAVTLVTCWPLNTNWKRLVVRAEIQ